MNKPEEITIADGPMTRPARFVTRPVEPERITAIQFDGQNVEAVEAFVAKVGGQFIEWIEPVRWVAFEDGREGFPVPLMAWVTRVEGSETLGMYEADEFDDRMLPTQPDPKETPR